MAISAGPSLPDQLTAEDEMRGRGDTGTRRTHSSLPRVRFYFPAKD